MGETFKKMELEKCGAYMLVGTYEAQVGSWSCTVQLSGAKI